MALLSSCQPGFVHRLSGDSLEDGLLTGGKTADGRNLTTASNDGAIQTLKEKITPNKMNLALASAIQAVSVEQTDRNGKVVLDNPERLKIEINLKRGYAKAETLNFDVSVKGAAGNLEFKNYSTTDAVGFRLSGQCDGDDCKKITMRLQRVISFGKEADAGFVYRTRGAKGRNLRITELGELSGAPRLLQLNQAMLAGRVSGNLTTTEVAWGTSTFGIRLNSEDQKICLSGLLVQTNDADEQVRVTPCASSATPLRAVMFGNDGAGSIVLRMMENTAELMMIVVAEGDAILDEQIGGEPIAPPPVISGKLVLPVDIHNRITKVFEKDRNKAEVDAEIKRVWLGTRRSEIENFITRIQPNLPVLTSQLNKHGVPNEFIIITLIESAFFKVDGYPVQVTASPNSTATGPWQIVDTTAPELGIKFFPTRKGKNKFDYNECDERAYIKESTGAAGVYFSRFLSRFQDPRLAVMAYHDGPGRVSGRVKSALESKRLSEANKNGLDFWIMFKMNMFPREKNGDRNYGADYVIKFLAAQFVARDPVRYGLTPISFEAIGSPGPAPVKPAKCI